jgi:hypothetical protein
MLQVAETLILRKWVVLSTVSGWLLSVTKEQYVITNWIGPPPKMRFVVRWLTASDLRAYRRLLIGTTWTRTRPN